jgi:endonuclease YncB( thermonuclease family)
MGACFSNFTEYCSLKNTSPETIQKRTFKNVNRYAKIVNIYDGDTFTIITKMQKKEPYYSYQLRLLGIDAPEMKPNLNIADRELHVSAAMYVRDVLKSLLPVNSIIWVEFVKEDKYGRLLGSVWTVKKKFCGLWQCKEVNLCDWLVGHNLVLAYDGKAKTNFTKPFLLNILNSTIPTLSQT